MKLDIKKAVLLPFSEEKWYLKLIFPSITIFLFLVLYPKPHMPVFAILISLLLIIISGIVLNGFFIQFRHNEICSLKPLIPELMEMLKDYFIYGLNSTGIHLMYAIPIFLLSIIGHIRASIIIAILTSILFLLSYLILFIAGSFSQNAYADSFHFRNAVKFKKIFSLMSRVKLEIFIYLLVFGALILFGLFIWGAVAVIVRKLHINTHLFLILIYCIASITTTVISLIVFNLQAQAYKIAKFRLENSVCQNIQY